MHADEVGCGSRAGRRGVQWSKIGQQKDVLITAAVLGTSCVATAGTVRTPKPIICETQRLGAICCASLEVVSLRNRTHLVNVSKTVDGGHNS